MNILFVSLGKYCSINESGIYTDLLRQFCKIGHKVYILSPIKKKDNYSGDTIIKEKNSEIIKVYAGNIQKTNSIEKGINTILLSSRYIAAIKKHLKEIKFDLVLYPTPPVTLYNVIKYVKERDDAKTYLMLKDIFPQNAIDLGLLSKKSKENAMTPENRKVYPNRSFSYPARKGEKENLLPVSRYQAEKDVPSTSPLFPD